MSIERPGAVEIQMKVCPTCNHQYAEGDGNFCVRDGTPLVSAASSAAEPQPGGQGGPIAAANQVANTQQGGGQQMPQPRAAAGAPLERLKCDWCQGTNESTALACRYCGAPLDIKNLVSDSGWREAPRIRDMTEIHFGRSTCQ